MRARGELTGYACTHAISVAHKGDRGNTYYSFYHGDWRDGTAARSIIFMYTIHRATDSLSKHELAACRREAIGTSERRARSTDGGRDRPAARSLLQPQRRRRVGLDEDGPEDLHVLARARLDVLVQDVDPSLCYHHTTKSKDHQNLNFANKSNLKEQTIRTKRGERRTNVLFFCAECTRIQSFLMGAMSDRSHPMRQTLSSLPGPLCWGAVHRSAGR